MSLSKLDPNVLLQNYFVALYQHPVRTKAYTSGVLNFISEIVASVIAGDKDPQTGSYLSPRVYKMALYGFFISGPLAHYLTDALQRAFAGRQGTAAKLLQILAANLICSPIQNTAFILSMAVIAGARTREQLVAAWKQSFLGVMKASWVTSPILLAIAQRYIPKAAWTPFFSLFAFFLSTYNNVLVKKKRAAAAAAAAKDPKPKAQ